MTSFFLGILLSALFFLLERFIYIRKIREVNTSGLFYPLYQIKWEDYLQLNLKLKRGYIVGYPHGYTINPETGECIVFPTPYENMILAVKNGDTNG